MKLLASDLDGTLFFPECKPGDIQAIQTLQKQGHLFGACTGRALSGTIPAFKDIIDCDFYIASSGAVICDSNLNILYDCEIPFEIAKEIVERYQSQCIVFIQTLRYYTVSDHLPEEVFKKIDSLDEIKGEKIYSVNLINKDKTSIQKYSQELIKDYPSVIGYVNMEAVDIVSKEASKGNALKKMKQILNADETYGIGDSYNDIPLIEEADIGFTFHDSPIEVKEVANMLVSSVEEAIGKVME